MTNSRSDAASNQAGISQDAAAKYAGLKGPSISRIENGKQAILPRTVRLLCQCYDIGAPTIDMLMRQAEESNDRAWYTMYSDTVPSWVESFLGLETEAEEVWTYEAELVPGLLQTPEYPPRLHTVLNEAVLMRPVGGPSVMATQLRHLIEMNKHDNITIQVLAFEAGAHVAMTGAFTMLRFPDELEMNAVFLTRPRRYLG